MAPVHLKAQSHLSSLLAVLILLFIVFLVVVTGWPRPVLAILVCKQRSRSDIPGEIRSVRPLNTHSSPTSVVGLRVGGLVVLLVEAVQVGDLWQQLEHALPVVLQRRDLTVEQVQTLQTLQVLLQQETTC